MADLQDLQAAVSHRAGHGGATTKMLELSVSQHMERECAHLPQSKMRKEVDRGAAERHEAAAQLPQMQKEVTRLHHMQGTHLGPAL